MLNVLDLFSSIGGFSLGLERTGGFRTVAFCEIDKKCRAILKKHWPGRLIFNDVRWLGGTPHGEFRYCEPFETPYRYDLGKIDIVCGGFPCQDISVANVNGAGIDGERSGLWSEFRRIVGEVRPRYAIVENVSALLVRGLDRVLGDLAEIGYDAEWHCIPASVVGAPHERERIWIIAYPSEGQRRPLHLSCERVAWSDAIPQRQEGAGGSARVLEATWGDDPILVADALSRMDDGIRVRLDGFNGCANAVVPQIPEMIGRAILQAEAA